MENSTNPPTDEIREEEKFIYNFTQGKIYRKTKTIIIDGQQIRGNFTTLVKTFHSEDGYKTIMINGKNLKQHRLLYEKYHNTKIEPEFEIDHVNLVKYDNRIENLRLVKSQLNKQNKLKHKNNTSGHKNVYYHKNLDMFMVQIAHKHYGYFKNIEDAIEKRNQVISELNAQGNIFRVE